LEAVLAQREWLAAGRFTVADLLMADALRIPKVLGAGDFPAIRSYVDRVCARPAFKRAHDGQMAFFAEGDKVRETA
jgi:glutathione S-transferase